MCSLGEKTISSAHLKITADASVKALKFLLSPPLHKEVLKEPGFLYATLSNCGDVLKL